MGESSYSRITIVTVPHKQGAPLDTKIEPSPRLRFLDEDGNAYPEWEERKLGEICKGRSGGTPKSTDKTLYGGSIPFLSISDMTEQGRYISHTEKSINEQGLEKSSAWIVPKGSIIYAMYASVGKICQNLVPLATSQALFSIDYVESFISKPYLVHSLTHTSLVHLRKVTTTGTQPNINANTLKSFPIPLPSLPEQEKIGEFLSSLDTEVEQAERLVSLLSDRKKAYAQRIFDRTLRFHDDNNNPYSEWEARKLGDAVSDNLIKMGRGKVISKTDIKLDPGEYPIYSSSALNNGKMGSYNQYTFDDELISWSIDGGGKFFYRPKHKFSLTNVSGWAKVESPLILTKFLFAALSQQWERLHFDYSLKAHPSVIQKLYTIPLPSLPEQEKIGEFLSTLDDEIDEAKRELGLLKERKKAYAQKIFGV